MDNLIQNMNYQLNEFKVVLDGESVFYTYFSEKNSRGKISQGCESSFELGKNNHDIAILLGLKNSLMEVI